MSTETFRPAFPDVKDPSVSYGLSYTEACRKHVTTTFHASRVYILSSASLAKNTDALDRLKVALQGIVVGVRIGMKQHTLISEVLEITQEVRSADADLIVTLGGGSLTDAAKIIAMAVANDVTTREDLLLLPNSYDDVKAKVAKPPHIPVIAIPTSLSGGEYTPYAGVTDDITSRKTQFSPPLRGPALVILDPELAVLTPSRIWIGSGVRAIDHCVESLCALSCDDDTKAATTEALPSLVSGLLQTRADANNAAARLECQLGVIGAVFCVTKRLALGASHGIGHMLGPLGVVHGETSCILLPAVCKYNAKHGDEEVRKRQEYVLEVLWSQPDLRDLLGKKGIDKETADLGDVLDVLIRELGMPRTLKDVQVGKDQLEKLAESSLFDWFLATNPVPILKKEQVLEILEPIVE